MKIPENANPYRVIVNGVEKVYEAGATVTDDASVNEIIEAGGKAKVTVTMMTSAFVMMSSLFVLVGPIFIIMQNTGF